MLFRLPGGSSHLGVSCCLHIVAVSHPRIISAVVFISDGVPSMRLAVPSDVPCGGISLIFPSTSSSFVVFLTSRLHRWHAGDCFRQRLDRSSERRHLSGEGRDLVVFRPHLALHCCCPVRHDLVTLLSLVKLFAFLTLLAGEPCDVISSASSLDLFVTFSLAIAALSYLAFLLDLPDNLM